MAIFHEHLQYHPDTVEIHKITDKEIKFLSDLQHELNTQDHVGQADPRFWVIMGKEKCIVPEGYEDGVTLIDNEAVEEVADNIDDAIVFFNKEFEENGDAWVISKEYDGYYVTSKEDNDYEECLADLDDLKTWLNEHNYGRYTFTCYAYRDKIYENTMFLTEKAAAEHLKANHYHYDEYAHTYAMTAWRSPEVEDIIKILQSVDFSAIVRK